MTASRIGTGLSRFGTWVPGGEAVEVTTLPESLGNGDIAAHANGDLFVAESGYAQVPDYGPGIFGSKDHCSEIHSMLRFYPPSTALSAYIDTAWIFDPSGEIPEPETPLFLSEGVAELVIQRNADYRVKADDQNCKIPRVCVSGFKTRPYRLGPTGQPRTIGIRLLPGGMAAFSRIPCKELENQIVPADQVINTGLMNCLRRALDAPSDLASLNLIWHGLEHNLKDLPQNKVRAIDMFINCLQEEPLLSIREFCEKHGPSIRTLERWFIELVGVSPATLLRTYRFKRLLQLHQEMADANWAELAVRAGYSDQAHLSREFSNFTGHPPTHWQTPDPFDAGNSNERHRGAELEITLLAGTSAVVTGATR